MRLTCLKCGHQVELATGAADQRISCVCGQDYTYPHVLNTGIRPNERAAERSRSRAFRAAGLVRNIGGFALGISLLSILFFPFGLVGAALGIYVLTMLRGPVGRYSGRRAALAALVLGVAVFAIEGAATASWLQARRERALDILQSSARDDLRGLLRAERLFRATHDRYGSFQEIRFTPPYGLYTLYLASNDVMAASRDGRPVTDPLPPVFQPGFAEGTFTAVAVANVDADEDLDIWVLSEGGTITHVANDMSDDAN